jgi:hypothetical protein
LATPIGGFTVSDFRYRVEVDIPIGRSAAWETEVEYHLTMGSALRSLLVWADSFPTVSIVDNKTGRMAALYDGELERNRDTVELYVWRKDKGWTCHWNILRDSLNSRFNAKAV